jgi:hypothetical protein
MFRPVTRGACALTGVLFAVACAGLGGEPDLRTAEDPAGYAWTTSTRASVATLDVPSGTGWQSDDGAMLEVTHEVEGLTVMVQHQAGIPAEMREEYVQSMVDANTRDAPKYEVVERRLGSMAGEPAACVDGRFDNGTRYVTRDCVLFVNDAAMAIMGRGPVERESQLKSVVDHMASSVEAL